MKERINCECGANFTRKHNWSHKKNSKQHRDYVDSMKDDVPQAEFMDRQIELRSCNHAELSNATVCDKCGQTVWKRRRYRSSLPKNI